MDIYEYIKANMILQVGRTLTDYICCETIVRDPIEFVHVVKENGGFIEYILWWERSKRSELPVLGSGGPLDPRDPDTYFFAETFIDELFDANTSTDEYIAYINRIQKEYSNLDMYPGFDVRT